MNRKHAEILKVILSSIAVIGVLTIAITAPNILTIFKPFIGKRKRISNWQLKRSLDKAEKKGLVKIERAGEVFNLQLSEKGHNLYRTFQLDEIKILEQKKWDGSMRLVIFDIPIRLNGSRKIFVAKIKQLGFILVQKSVWAYPYPCKKEIFEIAALCRISKYIRIITAGKIDNGEELVKKFGL